MADDSPQYSQHDVDLLADRVAGQQRLVMALIGFLVDNQITEKSALLGRLRRVAERRPDLPGGDVLREICDLLEKGEVLN